MDGEVTTDKLRNTNPVHIAFRTIDLYRAYLEHGLSETVASVAAIGELKTELDDLASALGERASNESEPPDAPPADERSWRSPFGERGGFSGRARYPASGWEGRL